MEQVETRPVETRVLPKDVQYYFIGSEGIVEASGVPMADCYIDEHDVGYFCNTEVMRYVRTVYGPHIGVMRERRVSPRVPGEARTPKMLLGLIKPRG